MNEMILETTKSKMAPKVVKTRVKSHATVVSAPKAQVVSTPKTPVVSAPKTKLQRVTFSVRAKVGSKVFLAGSFNDWDPTAKQMIDKNNEGLFSVTVCLEPGCHEYKYVIDGIWCADPTCTDWVHNDLGTLNSVKSVDGPQGC
jgi:1,4-alpha-glucan branching enzyme